jgi:hypothetical protein
MKNNLLLLIYINKIHYNIAYYNKTLLDFYYAPDKILYKNENNNDINNKEKENNITGNLNKLKDDIIADDIMIFRKFDQLDLINILNIDDEIDITENLADIYYYKYHYKDRVI